MASKSVNTSPGRCRNSPHSSGRPGCAGVCTSCSTSGRRVQISVPRGRKSRPTCAGTAQTPNGRLAPTARRDAPAPPARWTCRCSGSPRLPPAAAPGLPWRYRPARRKRPSARCDSCSRLPPPRSRGTRSRRFRRAQTARGARGAARAWPKMSCNLFTRGTRLVPRELIVPEPASAHREGARARVAQGPLSRGGRLPCMPGHAPAPRAFRPFGFLPGEPHLPRCQMRHARYDQLAFALPRPWMLCA